MSYHIFEKDAVEMICRDYGGDPRVMIIALNDAVSDELRDLVEAASDLASAIAADQGDEAGRLKVEDTRRTLEIAARKYSERRLKMEQIYGS